MWQITHMYISRFGFHGAGSEQGGQRDALGGGLRPAGARLRLRALGGGPPGCVSEPPPCLVCCLVQPRSWAPAPWKSLCFDTKILLCIASCWPLSKLSMTGSFFPCTVWRTPIVRRQTNTLARLLAGALRRASAPATRTKPVPQFAAVLSLVVTGFLLRFLRQAIWPSLISAERTEPTLQALHLPCHGPCQGRT